MAKDKKSPFPILLYLSILFGLTLFPLLIWRIGYDCPAPSVLVGLGIELMSIVIMCVFIGGCYLEQSFEPQTNRNFRLAMFCAAMACFADGCGWMVDGLNAPLFSGFNLFFNSLYPLANTATIYFYSLFLRLFIRQNPTWMDRYFKSLRAYIILLTAALVFNAKYGFLHYVENGEYHRGPLCFLETLIAGGFLLAAVVDIARKDMDREEKAGILASIILPLLLAVVQLAAYGISYTPAATTLSVILIYVHAHTRRARMLLQQRAEQEQQQTAVMLSQIQPHFLYNSLSSIVALCDIDPQKAKQTTLNFSGYLERNLEALNEREPVPFEKELDHVDAYLQIEQVRFGDTLHVEYELEATDFRIPSLVLQPLVENAVKHGLHPRPEGGTMTVASRAVPGGWEVTVTDDGVGFDTEHMEVRGHGVGIRNIRQRLSAQVGGTLTITSKPGDGTKAVLFIPKEDTK